MLAWLGWTAQNTNVADKADDAKKNIPSHEELRHLLPHDLLRQAFNSKIPWPKSERLDVKEVMNHFNFDGEPFRSILLALSLYGAEPAAQIDFLAAGVLPDPKHPDFPELALGLILILDQGPRSLFTGIDSRYVNSYFDPMTLKLITQFRDLPPHLVPYNRDRWTEEMGYTVDHWLWALFWFMAPITHSENLSNHNYQVSTWDSAKQDNMRANHGLVDPYAEALKGKLGQDVLAFSREIPKGPPREDELGHPPTFGDFVYWFAMVFHVHRPIIARYGRYPYRNGAVGRDDTEEEKEFLRLTGRFGCVDEESAKMIRKDVDRGVWTPLKG